jgi:hypothetical protein
MGALSGNRIVLLALAVGFPVTAVVLTLEGYRVSWLSAIVVPLLVYFYWPKKQQPSAQELNEWSPDQEAEFKRLLNQKRQ